MTPHGLCPHRVLTQLPKLNKLCPFDLFFFSCGVIPKLRVSRYSEQCFHMTSGNWTLTVTKSQDQKDQRNNTMFSNEKTETKASRKFRQSENKSRRALTQTQLWPCTVALHPWEPLPSCPMPPKVFIQIETRGSTHLDNFVWQLLPVKQFWQTQPFPLNSSEASAPTEPVAAESPS